MIQKKHRFHHHHFNCNSFWENYATHVAFSSYSCGSSHSHIWDPRIARLALLTTSFRMDESPSPRVVSHYGVHDPCLWMFGFLLSGTNEIWRVDYSRGDVWFGGLFRLVLFFIYIFISSFVITITPRFGVWCISGLCKSLLLRITPSG
jgi:hypothetical protein